MTPRPATILFILAAAAGLLFAAFSTFDFVQHLDRQLHGLHCSFVPGLGALDATGSSGCSLALMSPYSSVLRSEIWGGIPLSLAGMAVFAFLLFRGMDLWLGSKQDSQDATLLLLVATGVPVLTSLVMGAIAIVALGALCKLCVGIYAASFLAAGAAGWGWWSARSKGGGLSLDNPDHGAAAVEEQERAEPPAVLWGIATAELALFVIVPVALYVALVPDNSGFVGNCGSLVQPDDPYGVLVPLDNNVGATPMIEVLDPMCPACRGFERRLGASGMEDEVHRQALLFPLDDQCNWMVSSALHPGACAVSAAVLCAEDQPGAVLDWAFAEQDAIRAAALEDPGAAKTMVSAAFPELAGCISSNEARSRLNKSMRWAVANQLPVMMPQVFVDGVKLCDEDTDLGLDYALQRLLEYQPPGEVVDRWEVIR
jgi:uncharacterized membrane protein